MQYSTPSRRQTTLDASQLQFLQFHRAFMDSQCPCAPRSSSARSRTSLSSRSGARVKVPVCFWSILELWIKTIQRPSSWRLNSTSLLRRAYLQLSLMSAEILRSSSLCWLKSSVKKRALNFHGGSQLKMRLEVMKNKKKNLINMMIKKQKRRTRIKNTGQLKVIQILKEPK